jgi:hypothetical protein
MNPWLRAFRRLLSQPAFLVAVVLLAVSALTLNAAVGFLRLHFKKIAVPLAVRSLKEGLPPQLGDHWVQVSKDQPLDSQMEEVLATPEYVYRDYADTRVLSRDEVEQMRAATGGEYAALLSQHEQRHPAAFIRMGITYYTGMVDTVAHIPERCYVADGYEAKQFDDLPRTLGRYPDGRERNLKFRFISFEDQTGIQRVSRNVGYVFHVNGAYACDSFDVRFKLQDLRERYGYYAKVELMTQAPASKTQDAAARDESIASMTDFFAAALPEVEKCLPDWNALHAPGPARK